jgi:hypothetical protein
MNQQRALCFGLTVLFVVGVGASTAQAIPPFFKEFQGKYVKPDSDDEKDKAFTVLVTQTAKCNVCHVAGKDKKARNVYGMQLSMLLKKENFKAERLKDEADKCTAEIVAALDAVAAIKSGDGSSPTFGELIVAGKLPAGDAPAAVAATPAEPAPAPAPAPGTPAPAAASAPSPEAQEAIAKIQKLGGSVMALAMNDDSLVVDFHLGGTALTDEGLANVKALP